MKTTLSGRYYITKKLDTKDYFYIRINKKNHTFQYGYETTKLSFEEGCCLLKNSLDIIRPIDLMLDYTEITITEWFAAYKEYLKQSKKMINAY